VVTAALLGLLLLGPRPHPLHTSVAEIRCDAAAGVAEVVIRAYADDVAGALPGAGGDSALARYVRAAISIADRSGRRLPLEWLGATHEGDALVLRLRAGAPAGLRGGRIAFALLHDRFPDQVNMVRVSEGGRTATLVFLRGDGVKPLP
jgi:hypothetical protein